MKKILSLALAACLTLGASAFVGCTDKGPNSSGSKPEPEFDGWNVQNILERPVEKDDIRIGTYVTFADTTKGWSGKDQLERYYYAGLNFMPMICTLPKAGMLTEDEKTYISRDLTSDLWWKKIDEVTEEYNMLYYFSELSGLANDHEPCGRRESMSVDDAVSDAREIIPQLSSRCVGVHMIDEPGVGSFGELAKYARRYAAIMDSNGNKIGLDALVNHIGSYENMKMWVETAGASVGVISYDAYPFSLGGTITAAISLGNQVRQLANDYNMHVQMYPQSCNWINYRMPTLDEIKWHVNCNVAMGVTQFNYFNYSMYPAEGCTDAIFDIDGTVRHPEILEGLTEFHKELRVVDANIRLYHYMVNQIYSTKGYYGMTQLPNSWEISGEGIRDLDLIVSLYEPRANATETVKYISITNASYTDDIENREILLGENSGIMALEYLNPVTGKYEAVEILNGAFNLSLEKSGISFFRVTGDL